MIKSKNTSSNFGLIIIPSILSYQTLKILINYIKTGWGLLAPSRLTQTKLRERCRLWTILCPREYPPSHGQLSLLIFCAES
jgi:3-polyprenyl-4-hydroxybenzoate decarboxylase